jgi:hypothetical protein
MWPRHGSRLEAFPKVDAGLERHEDGRDGFATDDAAILDQAVALEPVEIAPDVAMVLDADSVADFDARASWLADDGVEHEDVTRREARVIESLETGEEVDNGVLLSGYHVAFSLLVYRMMPA